MKVKDLIKELETCNPDYVVCVEGVAISYVDVLPGYYDGSYDELVVNKNGTQKLVISDKGTKVVIKTIEPHWFLLDDPEAEVEFNLSPHSLERHKKLIDDIRKENREIIARVNKNTKNSFVPDQAVEKNSWLNKLTRLFKRC